MDDLIKYVRRNLPAVCSTQSNAANSQPAYVSEQAIQDALDAHRFTVRYAPLRPAPRSHKARSTTTRIISRTWDTGKPTRY